MAEAALPAVIVTPENATFCAELTNTAMLDAPAVVVAADVNAKSVNVTPVVSPVTASAYPDAGAIVAMSATLYVHCDGVVVQLKPP